MKTTIATALLLAAFLGTDDLAKQLRSKEAMERLAAVAAVREQKPEDAVALLSKALDDSDWEVVEQAARALGELADPKSTKALLRTALEVPITRVRRAACDALATLDAQDAVDDLVKKAKGKEPVNALQALTFVGEQTEVVFEIKKLDDLATHDDPRVAHWAGRAAVAGARDGSGLGALISLHRNEKNGLVALCGGLDTVAIAPSEKNIAIVQGLALDPGAVEVVSRRALRALAAVLDLTDSAHNLGLVTSGLDPRRGADLAWMVLQRMDTSELEESKLKGAREHVLELARRAADGGGPETRGAGLRVLENLGEDEDLTVATTLLESGAPRNRIRAAKALGRGFDDGAWVQAMTTRLGNEGDPSVREELCVQLGRRGLAEALVSLTTALEDDEWTVAVCAAVSLGKLNVDGSAAALSTITGERDWKLRGAAAAGYGWLYRAEAMEPLIDLLGDRDHSVKRTAYEGLKRLARRDDVPDRPAAWTTWWEENRERFVFRHPADTEEEKQKYGYSDLGKAPTASVYRRLYESFDVLALEGQYDRIQDLLDGIEIPYRLTNSSALQRAEIHPFSAFFANCTGEVAGDDVDRLSWFVRTGGHMFASCWSLTNTVQAVYPGVISHDESAGEEVVGSIPIFPVDPQSRFLPGVFPTDVRPYFHLEGSQLISIDRPEVGEVLIDSPAAAQTYGNGNVVAWFEAGHGVVLDSANHFYIHGFEWMPGLKDADDFQHYALNHMGLEFDRWREIEGESYWRSKSKAAEEVPETCVFNFITNFVRRYRAGLPR